MTVAAGSPGSIAQPISAGVLAAVVGFASAFPIVLQGLAGVGASPAEAASGLLALCIGQALLAIWLGLRMRMPIAIAWSTPGAALLASTVGPSGGFAVAVGAFLVAAAGRSSPAYGGRSPAPSRRSRQPWPAPCSRACCCDICLAPVRGGRLRCRPWRCRSSSPGR